MKDGAFSKHNLNHYMQAALKMAQLAFDMDEVPVGAVIEHEGQIIAEAHNLVEKNNDASAHAELLAMKEAAQKLGTWRLSECTLYVTLEPCAMCAGAAVNFRLKSIVFGAYDKNFGACGSSFDLTDGFMTSKVEVIGGVLEKECSRVLTDYFKAKRENKLN
ncbi:MAG: tRNA adenosine(34) deaminase TadA [Clostridia bacterium]|nr:tRNA adenosine(34) deaminase TadA [Clostridia bacterium]